jgi:ABC-2 type transport system ATP-binding protein
MIAMDVASGIACQSREASEVASVEVTASGRRQDVPETQRYDQGPPESAAPGPPEIHHQELAGMAAPGPAEKQAIVLRRVTVRYPGRSEPSVNELSLSIPPGQIFGLLGPNGSGKTTTITVIVGLLTPGSGHVEVLGGDPRSQATRRDIGVLDQRTAFYAKLSGRRNLAFAGSLHGYTGKVLRRMVDAALELANLEQYAKDPAGSYSGGMARRLAIARALLHDPRLIILDEPTASIDTTERAELWRGIRRLPEAGKTVLLTTHDLEEAGDLCDNVAIMRTGRLATPEPASPAYLREQYGAMVITIRAQASLEVRQQGMAALRTIPEITHLQDTTTDKQTGEFVVQATATVKHGIAGQLVTLLARNGVPIIDVDKSMPTLEEVFRELTTGPPKEAR